MNEEQKKKAEAWRIERDELWARRDAFYAKLQMDCPRLWRNPPEGGWHPKPSTPDTWDVLVYNLSINIEKLLTEIQEVIPVEEMPYVQQCKEKFGGLRFYISHYPEPIRDDLEKLIVDAEASSMKICRVCSKVETTQVRNRFPPPFEEHFFGWICPYCDECYEKEALERAKGSGVKELRKWHHETMEARKVAKKKKNEGEE